MAQFQTIDLNTWPRRPWYDHYLHTIPCTYSMTADVDITEVKAMAKAAGQKLYPTLVYGISQVVNRHEEFRMALNGEGKLGVWDVVFPSYTIFHQDTQRFSNLWTEFSPDYQTFCQAWAEDQRQWGDVDAFAPKPPVENLFNVSCIPWTDFTGFQLNLQKGYDYLPPIITMGKYHCRHGRTVLPVAVQVHHAVCDGFHTARFIEELRQWAQSPDL